MNGAEWAVVHTVPSSDVPHEAGGALARYVLRSGWSIGPSDTTRRRGIVARPGVVVAKWTNLTPAERSECDYVAVGSGRTGPIDVLKAGES